MPSTNKKNNNQLLLGYAGLATQLLVMLAISVWLGLKLDKWLKFSFPLLIWLLPLISIIAMIIKVIKDTSKQR
jgi:Mn2+/Fe2+ NRAMP family transporter